MENIYFGSVVYPNAVSFVDDFLRSLEAQTRKDFKLILINDGVEDRLLTTILQKYNIEIDLISYSEQFTPAELRINMLREAKKRSADYLVLGDIDDCFSPNRVECCLNTLILDNRLGFTYNKFLLMDGKSAMPELPTETAKPSDILEYNYLGLSNTALAMKLICGEFIDSLSECKSQVFDWYFFSRLLLNGAIGKITSDAITYYRLHEDNYAGIPKMTQAMIDKEISAKAEHYRILSNYGSEYEELYRSYRLYKFVVNSGKKQYYWWNLTVPASLQCHKTPS